MYYIFCMRTMIRSVEFDEFYNRNEYRVILFTIDHENFIEAEQVLLLNGFLKKSTKDYKKEIQKAQHILSNLQ